MAGYGNDYSAMHFELHEYLETQEQALAANLAARTALVNKPVANRYERRQRDEALSGLIAEGLGIEAQMRAVTEEIGGIGPRTAAAGRMILAAMRGDEFDGSDHLSTIALDKIRTIQNRTSISNVDWQKSLELHEEALELTDLGTRTDIDSINPWDDTTVDDYANSVPSLYDAKRKVWERDILPRIFERMQQGDE